MIIRWATIILFAAAGQDVHEYRSAGRGASAENRLAAAILAESLTPNCVVTNAIRRGADASGATHFEVSCADEPGYVLIEATRPKAISCLALAASADRGQARRDTLCRLPANRIDHATWRGLAAEAGIDCDVDQGALLGVTTAGGDIHEIGCRNAVGYRIERGDGSRWAVTDCLTLVARGAACDFTSPAEATGSFAQWIGPTGVPGCALSGVRLMGADGGDRYFEVACVAGTNVVARLDQDNQLVETIACFDAAAIGEGCREVSLSRTSSSGVNQ